MPAALFFVYSVKKNKSNNKYNNKFLQYKQRTVQRTVKAAQLRGNIHPRLLWNTNRSETSFRWLPVGTNQYRAAGYQRTICKVVG